MKILFVHQNFPAQFRYIAMHLAERAENQVVAIGSSTARSLPHVTLLRYGLTLQNSYVVHPFARRFDVECRRAEQIIYATSELLASGFTPDVVMVHCGWGESLPIKAIFPHAKIITYFEFFYRPDGLDVGFDPEWDMLSLDATISLRSRNAATLLALAEADVAVSPTAWQRSTFPEAFQSLIKVCHEGIDIETARPDPGAQLTLPNGNILSTGDEVVTFVARNLEPVRGYHSFMRALPQVLNERPHAQILIVGGDGVSYGASPPSGKTWRSVFFDEVSRRIDLQRVHFLGHLPYETYLKVLQISAAHVYLTYPFVLSWSMLEAMSTGCLVIGSSTGPVEEVIDGSNGILVDFFDTKALARVITAALCSPQSYAGVRQSARKTIIGRYHRVSCISSMMRLMV